MTSTRRSMTKGSNRDNGSPTDAIGEKLKETYGRLLKEPVPDKFLDLLNQLDAAPKAPTDEDHQNEKINATDDEGKDG